MNNIIERYWEDILLIGYLLTTDKKCWFATIFTPKRPSKYFINNSRHFPFCQINNLVLPMTLTCCQNKVTPVITIHTRNWPYVCPNFNEMSRSKVKPNLIQVVSFPCRIVKSLDFSTKCLESLLTASKDIIGVWGGFLVSTCTVPHWQRDTNMISGTKHCISILTQTMIYMYTKIAAYLSKLSDTALN